MEFRCGLFANFPCSPLSAISFSLFLSLNNCWVSNATKIIMLKNRAIFEWILRRGDLYCLSLRLLLYISAEYLLRAADKDSPFLQRDGFPFWRAFLDSVHTICCAQSCEVWNSYDFTWRWPCFLTRTKYHDMDRSFSLCRIWIMPNLNSWNSSHLCLLFILFRITILQFVAVGHKKSILQCSKKMVLVARYFFSHLGFRSSMRIWFITLRDMALN